MRHGRAGPRWPCPRDGRGRRHVRCGPAEGAQHRPAAGAAQGRSVRGRPVGPVEDVDLAVRQQGPGGGEVAGRVAGEEVTEVDHSAEGAVPGEDVGSVQVAVEPEPRARPCGGGRRVLPHGTDGVRVLDQPQLGGRGESPGEVLGGVGQRATAVPAGGCSGGGGAVEGGEKGGQGDRGVRGARGGGTVGGITGNPGGDEPGARKPFGRLTEALWYGYRQRKVRSETGQPRVFLVEQRVRGLRRPGEPDGEVVAEPPHLVVPAERSQLQGEMRQVGALLTQQIPDQVLGDVGLGDCHEG